MRDRTQTEAYEAWRAYFEKSHPALGSNLIAAASRIAARYHTATTRDGHLWLRQPDGTLTPFEDT